MVSYNNIFFFNVWQNGDIHVSRNFVKLLCQVARTFNPSCGLYYVHKNPAELLEDIPYIKTIRFDDEMVRRVFAVVNTDMPSLAIDGNLYVNTWYGAGNMRHMKAHGLTFDCLYDLFDVVLQDFFRVPLETVQPDPIQLFPSIDKHNVPDNIEMAKKLNASSRKKVMICNGNAISGYAKNIDLIQPTIDALRGRDDVELYYTNTSSGDYDQQLTSITNITTKSYNLLQIGYLARYFDLVIGRASGPSTFSINRESVFDSGTKILAFCRLEEKNPLWLGSRFKHIYSLASGKMEGYAEDIIGHVLSEQLNTACT